MQSSEGKDREWNCERQKIEMKGIGKNYGS